jgi:type IV pilus assembly protein PilE
MSISIISRRNGFTIIELMIVVIIIAILVALAYPAYIDYVRKAKRGEAQQLLLNWAINQEIYRSNNPTYDDGTDLDVPTHDEYTFPAPTVTANTYLLTANASGDQANDKARNGDSCASLSLNENSRKTPAPCWE